MKFKDGCFMDPIYTGMISVIPQIITIFLAIVTREVVVSLLLGIISGSLIYCAYAGSNLLQAIKLIFVVMAKSIGENVFIIIFISMLGALVRVITVAGGAKAYAKWASERLKSRKIVQIATVLLGIFLSIDDYFNCLAVGTVMRPIADKYRISRVKFAYIIASMAAPVCVIAPISSWAAYIVSCIDSAGLDGMTLFIGTIPYNFYALLTVIFVFVLCCGDFDFGLMKEFEDMAVNHGNLSCCDRGSEIGGDDNVKMSDKATAWDLLLPVVVLVVVSIFVMLETGGFFSAKNISIQQALSGTDSGLSITIGAVVSLTVSLVMFVPRKLISFKGFMEEINQGIKSMASTFIILVLAWTMSEVCGNLICTGKYIGDMVTDCSIEAAYIPTFVFILAGVLSLSLGTSWGTFGILIPVVATVCKSLSPEMMLISLSATLSGAVFGDHCSPISDTMVLSSTVAGCNHMDHVLAQMPYAGVVAIASFIGFIAAGFTENALISIIVSSLVMSVSLFFISREGNKIRL